MALKYTNIFNIYPNWDFWFENIPSGNPASDTDQINPISV
jgi:hypothetical protein